MKTKKLNALFGLLLTAFAVALFLVMPAPNVQAEQPGKPKPGLSYEKAVDKITAEPKTAPPAVEVATVDSTAAGPVDVPSAPPSGGGTVVNIDWLLNQENAIAAVLMLLLTFLSRWLPFLSNIGDTGKRALVVGLTVIAGFVVARLVGGEFSWGGFASLSLTYLLTSLGYDKGLKPLGLQTPKVAAG